MKRVFTPLAMALGVASIFTSPVQAGEVSAKSVEEVSLDPAWTAGNVGKGIKFNSEFVEGNLFFLYPFSNSIGEGGTMDGSTFFVESYNTWASGGELGASLGLGYRRLISNQSVSEAMSVTDPGLLGEGVFVGANAFIDYARTGNGGNFWQAGLGLEAGSRYVEFRANYYIPLSNENVIGSRTTTSSSTSSSTAATSRAVRTTKTTTTTRSVFETYEEALEGWDVEVAVLVPGLDRYMDMQLIAGYYGYTGDRQATSNIDGLRLGIEARPVPNLVVGATWFESDQLYRDNWLASVSIEIPWGQGEMRDMLASVFRPRRRHLAERMFKIVRRKNSAITSSGVTEENTSNSTSSSTTTSSRNRTQPAAVASTPPVQLPPDQNDR
ncbi:MAG: inverse autotransporter beta domain-containing protein [Verrucomicrobiales bacterium]|nr:inverse autotransporter beta domain-containing protein [Verrucomicrobiales bacterium]